MDGRDLGFKTAYLGVLLALAGLLALPLLFLAQDAAAQPTVIATISFGASRAGAIDANSATNRVYAAQDDLPPENCTT